MLITAVGSKFIRRKVTWSCWITLKSTMQILFMSKCDWILQDGHLSPKKLPLHINTTLKCPCLFRNWALNHYRTCYRPTYTHVQMPDWWNGTIVHQNSHSCLTFCPIWITLRAFLLFLYTEAQLGHQTWPRAIKGRPLDTGSTKESFDRDITTDPF